MKILILSKIEGVNGVFSAEQVKEGTAKNSAALKLQMEEANAIIRGAFTEGATQVVVKGLENQSNAIGMEALDERAEIILGEVPVSTWREELKQNGFNAIFLHGYHAMANTAEAMFPSTLRSTSIYRVLINDHEAGEVEETAIRYGLQNLPITMVTGDDKTVAETKNILEEQAEYVEVKKGTGWMPAVKTALEMLEAGAKAAMKKIPQAKPYIPDFPLKIRVEYLSPLFLDLYKGPGTRINSTTLELVYQTPSELLEKSGSIRNGWILPT